MSPTRPWRSQILFLLAPSYLVLADDDLGTTEVLPTGFSPRFFDGAFPVQSFVKRQDLGTCPSGGHSCAEIGEAAANKCCAADQYCYYQPDWNVGCCGFGTTCDPQCTGTSYRTNATTVYTTSITASAATTAGTGSVLQSVITSPFVGCAKRACAVSAYRCPSSMGGGCCNNNEICASSSQCLASVSSTPTLVATRGCSGTTSATACATDGGCCLTGQTCISIAGTLGCTGTPDGPSGTNLTTASEPLSQGAKAGIGAGVAIGAAIVIGALTWFCIRRRREARTAGERTRSRGPTPGPDGTTLGGGMSEASGPRRVHRSGLAHEYVGPHAVSGPYTQQDDTAHAAPDNSHSGGGVPRSPQGPGDIRPPVEIGESQDRLKESQMVRGASLRSSATTRTRATRGAVQGGQEGVVYEMEGSNAFPEPSPMSPDELLSAQSPTPEFHTPGSPGLISPQGQTLRNDYLGTTHWDVPKN